MMEGKIDYWNLLIDLRLNMAVVEVDRLRVVELND